MPMKGKKTSHILANRKEQNRGFNNVSSISTSKRKPLEIFSGLLFEKTYFFCKENFTIRSELSSKISLFLYRIQSSDWVLTEDSRYGIAGQKANVAMDAYLFKFVLRKAYKSNLTCLPLRCKSNLNCLNFNFKIYHFSTRLRSSLQTYLWDEQPCWKSTSRLPRVSLLVLVWWDCTHG